MESRYDNSTDASGCSARNWEHSEQYNLDDQVERFATSETCNVSSLPKHTHRDKPNIEVEQPHRIRSDTGPPSPSMLLEFGTSAPGNLTKQTRHRTVPHGK
ncbi:hypothetical protein CBL_03464 [Carabus blaptoides fortunei]